MRILVVALEGAFDTGLAALLDAFGTANELAELGGMSVSRFEVTVVGTGRRVTTAQGMTRSTVPFPLRQTPDWVVVPAISVKLPAPLVAALGAPQVAAAGRALRTWATRGAGIAAACIGTFVLAESGLLDEHESTTTWWLAPLFRQRYPAVQLDETRMIVKSGKVVTAGAALSHMDLALWLIRQKSPRLAALTARYLIVDSRPTQSAYAMVDHLAHNDPMVERFESWARSRLKQGFSLDDAAVAVGASKRTLARRLAGVLGRTPLSYFQELRVERAVHLLRTTDESVDQIAARVGYADGVTLRTLLRKKLGRGVRELRGGVGRG
ncbi:MAG TPA: helix-turn-helix domain-containing protein [Gemmatimonadales bacterium]|nr:helix-turn-helix domain-containing protein [Gemmatimonadales bacterium]